jgi:hypothetical protein
MKTSLFAIVLICFVGFHNKKENAAKYLEYNHLELISIKSLSDSLDIRNEWKKTTPNLVKDHFLEGVKHVKDTLERIYVFYSLKDKLRKIPKDDLSLRFPYEYIKPIRQEYHTWLQYNILTYPKNNKQLNIYFTLSGSHNEYFPITLREFFFYQEINYKVKGDTLFTIVKHYTSPENKLFLEKEVKIKL